MEAITCGSVTHIQVWPTVWSVPALQWTSLNWDAYLNAVILWLFQESVHLFTSLFLEILDYRESTYSIQRKSWVLTVLG